MAERRRGSRTANRKRGAPSREVSRWRIWLKRALVWGGALAALLLLALATSVLFASRSMPGYATLMNSQVGQTIVVRARDGSQIVSMGPSYSERLHSDEFQQAMKAAMDALEDRPFYAHPGIDPLGLLQPIYVACGDDTPIRAT